MELYHFGFSTWAPAPVIELMRREGESEWAGIERIARERSDS